MRIPRLGTRTGWIAACLVFSLPAQEPVFRGGVDLVEVLATVRDKKGALVADLQQADFKIYEDGKEQVIRRFTRQTDLPLTIGMLVDVSGSVADEIPNEQRAALQFFKQVLRTQDQAFVIGFAGQAMLLQDTTSSIERLEEGLQDLPEAMRPPPMPRRFQANQFPRTQGPFPGGNPGPGNGRGGRQGIGGTVLYDAVFLAADEVLQPLSGRKVIILITDGADAGSRLQLPEAMEALLRSDTIVYSIYVDANSMNIGPVSLGGGGGGFGGGDRGVVEKFSDRTGGRVYNLERPSRLTGIFEEIEEELRSQYSIAYSPKNEKVDDKLRRIEVKVKDHKVRAREGYYPRRESGQ